MRILVTGAGGFAGRHLLNDLAAAGHTPVGFDIAPPPRADGPEWHTGDLRDAETVERVVQSAKPDACVHLGGIAYVPMGWTDPAFVFSVNVGGTVNVLEAFRKHAPQARIVAVTSDEVYGRDAREGALAEDAEMRPSSLYAVSKLAADMTARLYAVRHKMAVIAARPGNHCGPGQSVQFVVPAFASQIADIKSGRAEPVLRVGNLDSERDFTDVRDIVRGYRLLAESGTPGEAYNIASGKRVRIGEILDRLCEIAGVRPDIRVDPARFRPADRTPLLDTHRIRARTGWEPQIQLPRTLSDILEAWMLRSRDGRGT